MTTATTAKIYLGLALDPKYVEGYRERIREDEPEDEALFRGICGRTKITGKP